jgi:hypothetical protein
MSYPGSGIYNRFLLSNLETPDYLELYVKHGGNTSSMLSMKIDPADLPDENDWNQYLNDQPLTGAIMPGAGGLEASSGPVAFRLMPDGRNYGFAVPETTLTMGRVPAEGYRSFLFEEFFEDKPYDGQRYFIRAAGGEVAVYDLFTNTMIALYATGFSSDLEEIPSSGSRFLFQLDRSVIPAEPVME